MEQDLEKMLGLALGFALLFAQTLESTDDVGEFLLERERWDRNNQLFDELHVQARHDRATFRNPKPPQDLWMI